MCNGRQDHLTSVALGFSSIKKEWDLITSKVSVTQKNSKHCKSENLKHTIQSSWELLHTSCDQQSSGGLNQGDSAVLTWKLILMQQIPKLTTKLDHAVQLPVYLHILYPGWGTTHRTFSSQAVTYTVTEKKHFKNNM